MKCQSQSPRSQSVCYMHNPSNRSIIGVDIQRMLERQVRIDLGVDWEARWLNNY